jgi:beta-glucosidase/6-phospho-beta-glucosidase/beta-galactosidase
MRSIPVLALAVLLAVAPRAGAAFPPGFLWGTAIAGFQTDMGGASGHDDQTSDWWVWTHDAANITAHRVSGQQPEAGPAFYDNFKSDLGRARTGLHSNAFRMSIEWSRIFPTSTAVVDASGGIDLHVLQQLDALANFAEVAHYRSVLAASRSKKMKPLVTLSHFSLPLWIHDPIAARTALTGIDANGPLPTGFPGGWLDASTVGEFGKFAAYVGWKFGDLVDFWAPLNEPVVVAVSGYLNVPGVLSGNFPPGAFTFTGLIAVLLNEVGGNAAAYDALHAWDTVDADGDGSPARVGLVTNLPAFHPKDGTKPADVAGAVHADYLFNRLFMNAAINGDLDANANGTVDVGEHHPELVGKADFIGVNYYQRAVATGLGVPLTPVIPLLDFIPTISYQTPQNPTAPVCPSTCTEFGWEIYPAGLTEMLAEAGSYGLPIYITENGLADGDDDQRPGYLVRHLNVIDQAIAGNVADVRGYFHWSLMDNFEWSSGYYPKFGLYVPNPKTPRLKARKSAKVFARITKANAIPADLLALYP